MKLRWDENRAATAQPAKERTQIGRKPAPTATAPKTARSQHQRGKKYEAMHKRDILLGRNQHARQSQPVTSLASPTVLPRLMRFTARSAPLIVACVSGSRSAACLFSASVHSTIVPFPTVILVRLYGLFFRCSRPHVLSASACTHFPHARYTTVLLLRLPTRRSINTRPIIPTAIDLASASTFNLLILHFTSHFQSGFSEYQGCGRSALRLTSGFFAETLLHSRSGRCPIFRLEPLPIQSRRLQEPLTPMHSVLLSPASLFRLLA